MKIEDKEMIRRFAAEGVRQTENREQAKKERLALLKFMRGLSRNSGIDQQVSRLASEFLSSIGDD